MSKIGTPEQEAAHKAQVHELCYHAMLDLRTSLQANFNPSDWGYKTVEEVRAGIISRAWKSIEKESAAYLARL